MTRFDSAIAVGRYSLRSPAVRRLLWTLLALALGCLLIALWLWGPAQREHRRLAERIDARRQIVVQAERLQQAVRAQQQVLPRVEALEKKRQARAAQADLIQGVARLAARRKVHIVSQSFDEGRAQQDPAQAQPLYLELGLLGDYAALRRFTGDLATLPMWLEIVEERLELAGQGSRQVKAQLRLLTYRNAREPS